MFAATKLSRKRIPETTTITEVFKYIGGLGDFRMICHMHKITCVMVAKLKNVPSWILAIFFSFY